MSCEHVRTQGITDAWWDASLEDTETETKSESQASDITKDGDSQGAQDSLPQTVEAPDPPSEPESVPQEEGTGVPPEEGPEDEEATETVAPTEPLERGV